MSKSIYKIAVVAYILVAILTFGHAFNNLKAPQELMLYGSAGCAVAWPLYWSAQLFAKE